jgi:hypothetical protein
MEVNSPRDATANNTAKLIEEKRNVMMNRNNVVYE